MWWRGHNGVCVIFATRLRVRSELVIVAQVRDVAHGFCNVNYDLSELTHIFIFNQETDYILSYFDNGEEYGNDDDDADEGPVYWRIYRARGISINTFCKKTERCTRKLTYYSSKKGTSQVSAKEKTLQSLSNHKQRRKLQIHYFSPRSEW